MSTLSLKARKGLIAFVIFILAMVGPMIACDDGPTQPPCANACGITSPVKEAEQGIINFLAPDHQDTLSGGN